jgi:hypothetical protein
VVPKVGGSSPLGHPPVTPQLTGCLAAWPVGCTPTAPGLAVMASGGPHSRSTTSSRPSPTTYAAVPSRNASAGMLPSGRGRKAATAFADRESRLSNAL